jgi:hypothetical protein
MSQISLKQAMHDERQFRSENGLSKWAPASRCQPSGALLVCVPTTI